MLIMLDAYIGPAAGARYGSRPVWINPNQITHMGVSETIAERSSQGVFTSEKVDVTSIRFAGAIDGHQAGVDVLQTPQQIRELIQEASK